MEESLQKSNEELYKNITYRNNIMNIIAKDDTIL